MFYTVVQKTLATFCNNTMFHFTLNKLFCKKRVISTLGILETSVLVLKCLKTLDLCLEAQNLGLSLGLEMLRVQLN